MYTLPNKLKVLIISDKTTRTNAAAITVNSGVVKEGRVTGLAHFTEHMLFLGSKKYPNATQFVDFITQKHGLFNGYTDFDTTAFYFRIHQNHFPKGLDIFSRFFIDPLFNPQYIQKEISSVNSEFERNLQIDGKRKEQVLRDISHPGSHFHKFTTGNSKTLVDYCRANNLNLRDEVIKYYRRHFRSDNMKLIVYGNKSLNHYKNLVDQSFQQIPYPQGPYNWRDTASMPFQFFKEGKIALYKTLNNHQNLEINILIPDLFKSLPHNIGLYFKVILNYKGKGSLRDILMKRGLGSHVKSALRKTYDGFSIFKLSLFLTRKGINQLSRVLRIIYKYFQFMRKFSFNTKLYSFVKRYYDVKFLFMRKRVRAFTFVRNMCLAFLKYPKKMIFAQHRILYMYDQRAIQNFGDHFVINNSIILLGFQNLNPNLLSKFRNFLQNFEITKVFDRKEPWYGVLYSKYDFSPNFMRDITYDTQHPQSLGFTSNFLFLKGFKMPRNMRLVKTCPRENLRSCIMSFRRDGLDLTPMRIIKNNQHELWHKEDRSYLISRLNFFNQFIFPINVKDPYQQALFKSYVFGLAHHFKNYFYSQKIKQNLFKIKMKSNSFIVKIFSFSQNIGLSAIEFFNRLKNIKISKNVFLVVKDELRKTAMSKINLIPHLAGFLNFFSLVLKDFVNNHTLIKAIERLTYNDFQQFSRTIFDKMYIKSFINGNATKEDANRIFNQSIRNNFRNYRVLSRRLKNYKNLQANIKGYYVFREKIVNKFNVNHAALNFYQLGQNNLQNVLLAYLIRILCGNIYFTQLRIKEQLGYITKGKIVAVDDLLVNN